MADAKKPEAKPNAAASKDAKKEEASPEASAAARVSELQNQITMLEQEIKSLEGRVLNRDPRAGRELDRENKELKAREASLEKALYALLFESFKPAQADEIKTQYEALRTSATEYFTKMNIDPEIWKNIAS